MAMPTILPFGSFSALETTSQVDISFIYVLIKSKVKLVISCLNFCVGFCLFVFYFYLSFNKHKKIIPSEKTALNIFKRIIFTVKI